MKLKSSPILGTIGLLYGIITGAVISHTVTKDYYESIEPKVVTIIEKEIVQPNVIIETLVNEQIIEEAIPLSVEKKIPNDLTKRCPQWESKIREHRLPVKLFSYIMWRESRCIPNAHNKTLNRDKSQDRGLLQINSTWKTVTKNICGTDLDGLFDPTCNLKVAKYLYDNGGAGHWSM
jgi:hypothetical protein